MKSDGCCTLAKPAAGCGTHDAQVPNLSTAILVLPVVLVLGVRCTPSTGLVQYARMPYVHIDVVCIVPARVRIFTSHHTGMSYAYQGSCNL